MRTPGGRRCPAPHPGERSDSRARRPPLRRAPLSLPAQPGTGSERWEAVSRHPSRRALRPTPPGGGARALQPEPRQAQPAPQNHHQLRQDACLPRGSPLSSAARHPKTYCPQAAHLSSTRLPRAIWTGRRQGPPSGCAGWLRDARATEHNLLSHPPHTLGLPLAVAPEPTQPRDRRS